MKYPDLQVRARLELERRVNTLQADVADWTSVARTTAMGLSAAQRTALVGFMGELDTLQRNAFTLIDKPLPAPAFSDGNVALRARMTGSHELWQIFRDMLWQLEDPYLKAPARSAMRIAADCYALGIRRARTLGAISPDRFREQPMVYLDAVESPATAGRRQNAGMLNGSIRQWRNLKLPLPIVLLPRDFAQSMASYCAIQHEVGHNLDQDLGLLAELRSKLPGVLPANREPQWRRWSAEILADALGVVLGGAGFALSLCSLALSLSPADHFKDLDPAAEHPPLALRAPLVAELLRCTGVPEHAQLANDLLALWGPVPRPAWVTDYDGHAAVVATLFMTEKLDVLTQNPLLQLNNTLPDDQVLAGQLAAFFLSGAGRPVPNTFPARLVPSAVQLAIWQADPLDAAGLAKIEAAAEAYLQLIPLNLVLAAPAAGARKAYYAELARSIDFSALRKEEDA